MRTCFNLSLVNMLRFPFSVSDSKRISLISLLIVGRIFDIIFADLFVRKLVVSEV